MSAFGLGFRGAASWALACALGACALNESPIVAASPPWGSHWQLESIGGQAVLPSPVATLAFLQSPQVAGHGSCNRFAGHVEVEHNRLKFGTLATTRMACAPAVGEQEARYLKALQLVQRFEVRGHNLLLLHAAQAPALLQFVRSEPRH